jgi:hypothetical protein
VLLDQVARYVPERLALRAGGAQELQPQNESVFLRAATPDAREDDERGVLLVLEEDPETEPGPDAHFP